MSAIERITKAAHLINMNDIIREGNPTLRAVAEEVTFPLSDQEIILGEKMMQFLISTIIKLFILLQVIK